MPMILSCRGNGRRPGTIQTGSGESQCCYEPWQHDHTCTQHPLTPAHTVWSVRDCHMVFLTISTRICQVNNCVTLVMVFLDRKLYRVGVSLFRVASLSRKKGRKKERRTGRKYEERMRWKKKERLMKWKDCKKVKGKQELREVNRKRRWEEEGQTNTQTNEGTDIQTNQ